MRCRWVLVVTSFVAIGTQAAYSPIQWAKFPSNELVLMPKGFSGNLRGLSAPQELVVSNLPGTLPNMIPQFTAKRDNTIVLGDVGLCLEAGGTNHGDKVSVNRCSGWPAQQWERVSDGHGRQRIQLKGTSMCLDVVDKDGIDAAPVQLHECENKVTESWRFEEEVPVLGSYASAAEMRQMIIFLLALAGVGVLRLGTWFQKWQPKACAMAVNQGGIPLTANHEDGMSLTAPTTLRRNSMDASQPSHPSGALLSVRSSVGNAEASIPETGTRQASPSLMDRTLERREVLRNSVHAGVGAASLGMLPLAGHAKDVKTWQQVPLRLAVTESPPILFDIEFDDKNPNRGWIIGNRGTFLETSDGGKTWDAKSFGNMDPEEEINYRYTKCSFKDGEGWIIGKPSVLLHTRDTGRSWERIPLDPRTPGDPFLIVAFGSGKAEMATTAGAIYITEDGGRNFKAQVKETIDATLNRVSSSGVQGASYFTGSINNIQRDADGSYLAVSTRGNFYLTWRPGDDFWLPHNRLSSQRITAMGFVNNRLVDGIWQTTAGGNIWRTKSEVDTNLIQIPFDRLQVRSGGIGILDVVFLPDGQNAWACGGAGAIFRSQDGGATWQKDESADDLPGNLYKVKFFGNTGYMLGSNGLLLRTV